MPASAVQCERWAAGPPVIGLDASQARVSVWLLQATITRAYPLVKRVGAAVAVV
jgi:hypothetical protein